METHLVRSLWTKFNSLKRRSLCGECSAWRLLLMPSISWQTNRDEVLGELGCSLEFIEICCASSS